MKLSDFGELITVRFQERMKPAALRIYQSLFRGCRIEDLREQGVKVHTLDKEFGIDALLHLTDNQWVSIQEKYRRFDKLAYGDFTQEFKNAVGTPHESDGEWFKLGAQLYFYGWANAEQTDFVKWFILDVARYKVIVERAGGLDKLGILRQNRAHGSASFYAIPPEKLSRAMMFRWPKDEWIT